MGTYVRGILGSFSGKIGTVIGSKWRGIDYMRALPRPSSKAPTEAQLIVREKFALATTFVAPLRTLLDIGFQNAALGQTGVNAATSHLITNAINDSSSPFVIDYPRVLFSKGGLTGSVNGVATVDAGSLVLSWDDNSNFGNAKTTDNAVILMYNREKSQNIYTLEGPLRSVGTYTLPLPASFVGDMVEVWLAFITEDKKSISTSIHAGSVVVV